MSLDDEQQRFARLLVLGLGHQANMHVTNQLSHIMLRRSHSSTGSFDQQQSTSALSSSFQDARREASPSSTGEVCTEDDNHVRHSLMGRQATEANSILNLLFALVVDSSWMHKGDDTATRESDGRSQFQQWLQNHSTNVTHHDTQRRIEMLDAVDAVQRSAWRLWRSVHTGGLPKSPPPSTTTHAAASSTKKLPLLEAIEQCRDHLQKLQQVLRATLSQPSPPRHRENGNVPTPLTTTVGVDPGAEPEDMDVYLHRAAVRTIAESVYCQASIWCDAVEASMALYYHVDPLMFAMTLSCAKIMLQQRLYTLQELDVKLPQPRWTNLAVSVSSDLVNAAQTLLDPSSFFLMSKASAMLFDLAGRGALIFHSALETPLLHHATAKAMFQLDSAALLENSLNGGSTTTSPLVSRDVPCTRASDPLGSGGSAPQLTGTVQHLDAVTASSPTTPKQQQQQELKGSLLNKLFFSKTKSSGNVRTHQESVNAAAGSNGGGAGNAGASPSACDTAKENLKSLLTHNAARMLCSQRHHYPTAFQSPPMKSLFPSLPTRLGDAMTSCLIAYHEHTPWMRLKLFFTLHVEPSGRERFVTSPAGGPLWRNFQHSCRANTTLDDAPSGEMQWWVLSYLAEISTWKSSPTMSLLTGSSDLSGTSSQPSPTGSPAAPASPVTSNSPGNLQSMVQEEGLEKPTVYLRDGSTLGQWQQDDLSMLFSLAFQCENKIESAEPHEELSDGKAFCDGSRVFFTQRVELSPNNNQNAIASGISLYVVLALEPDCIALYREITSCRLSREALGDEKSRRLTARNLNLTLLETVLKSEEKTGLALVKTVAEMWK